MGKGAKVLIWILVLAVIGLGIGLVVVYQDTDKIKGDLSKAQTELKAAQDALSEMEGDTKLADELEAVKADLAAAQEALSAAEADSTIAEELAEVKAELERVKAEVADDVAAALANAKTEWDTAKAELENELTNVKAELQKAKDDVASGIADGVAAAQADWDKVKAALEAELTEAKAELEKTKADLADALKALEEKVDPALTTSTTGVVGEKTEVVIWHTFTNAQDAMLNEIAEAFNASQDAVTVNVQSQPYQGFLDNVYSAVAGGVGPDIIFDYASTAANYVSEGLVADLTKYIIEENMIPGFEASLPAGVFAEANGFVDGRMHAIPAVTTGPILFYNKTLYEELGLSIPTTWADYEANAKAILEAKEMPGYAVDSLTDQMQMLILQGGSGYIDVANQKVLFDNDITIGALNWLGGGVQAGYFALVPSTDYWSNDFSAGIVGSYIGSCAGIPYIVPDGFEFDVAPAPVGEDVKWFPAWNRGPIVFATGEAKERSAVEFIAYFLNPENNLKWCKAMIALSPYAGTNALQEYKEFVAENPALAAVEANLPYAGALPSIRGAYEVRNELRKMATLVAGGADAADVLADAVEASNEALQGK